MSQDLIVVATIGQRDLQLVATDEDRLYRISLERSSVGLFHRALLAGQVAYEVYLPDDARSRVIERRSGGAIWKDGIFEVSDRCEGGKVLRPAHSGDVGSQADEVPSRILLFPGLLWEPLLRLRSELNSGVVDLRRLVFIDTQRDPASRWAEHEPTAAADVLRRWLLVWLPGLQDKGGDRGIIQICTCLEKNEEALAADEEGNRFLLPAAANRIDQAIRAASVAWPGATIRLHDSGGIPAVPDMLRAAARFRFGSRVEYLPTLEDTERPAVLLSGRSRTAVEILEARRRARDLVKAGQFQAAAVLATEQTPDRFSAPSAWRQCLAVASLYFQGYMTKAKAETDRLPSGFPSDEPLNTGARLKLLLRNDQPKSLHIALRAEAALISGDVLAAAALTVTFLDVALLDAADIAFGSRFPAGFIDYVKREVAIPKGDPLRLRLKALAPPPAGLDWIRPPYDSEIEEWLRFSRLRFQKEWQESALFRVIGETGLPALAKSLEQLTRALHRPKTTAGRDSPADFRNRVIHSFPKESEIERAVEDYVRVALWTATPSTRAANRALRFLSPTTAPTQVLNELGVGNARLLYDSLVEALCSDIAACPLV